MVCMSMEGGNLNSAEAAAFSNRQGYWFPRYAHCRCCHGSIHDCRHPTCIALGRCSCTLADKDQIDPKDDTWKDEWFADCRNCSCCQGYIYKCQGRCRLHANRAKASTKAKDSERDRLSSSAASLDTGTSSSAGDPLCRCATELLGPATAAAAYAMVTDVANGLARQSYAPKPSTGPPMSSSMGPVP